MTYYAWMDERLFINRFQRCVDNDFREWVSVSVSVSMPFFAFGQHFNLTSLSEYFLSLSSNGMPGSIKCFAWIVFHQLVQTFFSRLDLLNCVHFLYLITTWKGPSVQINLNSNNEFISLSLKSVFIVYFVSLFVCYSSPRWKKSYFFFCWKFLTHDFKFQM